MTEPSPPDGDRERKHRRAREHRWSPDDDLLAGFDRAGRPRRLQAFFAATLAASLLVWDLAFTLGAYHTVFYSRLFQIFVVATVMLVGSVLLRRIVRVRRLTQALLAVPLVWLLVRVIAYASSDVQRYADLALGVLTLISMPFTLWALARIMSPEYFELRGQRLKAISVIIVVLVGVTGLLVGQFNYVFTTCQDYVVAGDNQPGNCHRSDNSRPYRP